MVGLTLEGVLVFRAWTGGLDKHACKKARFPGTGSSPFAAHIVLIGTILVGKESTTLAVSIEVPLPIIVLLGKPDTVIAHCYFQLFPCRLFKTNGLNRSLAAGTSRNK